MPARIRIFALAVAALLALAPRLAYAACDSCESCVQPDCTLAEQRIEEVHAGFYGSTGRLDLSEALAEKVVELQTWWTDPDDPNAFFTTTVLPALKAFTQEDIVRTYETARQEGMRGGANVAERERHLVAQATTRAGLDSRRSSTSRGDKLGATVTAARFVSTTTQGDPQDGANPANVGAAATLSTQVFRSTPLDHGVAWAEFQDTCVRGATPGCLKGATDPARVGGLWDPGALTAGGLTIPARKNGELIGQAIMTAPSIPVLSPAELRKNPYLAAGGPNDLRQAWTTMVVESQNAQNAGLQEYVSPDTAHILAHFDGNEALVSHCSGDEGISRNCALNAAAMGVAEPRNIMASLESDRGTKELELSALIIEDMITYDILQSKRRQEMLVAGILMYEIIAHKRWMEEHEALLIAQREQAEQQRLAAAAHIPEEENETP